MMLLDLICFDCIMEQVKMGVPHSNPGESIPTPFEHVNNSGVYEVSCSKGHKSKAIIDNIDFEILFEYGLNAIADGYFREAVSSLTAAMERYFEFFTKVMLRSSAMDFTVIDKTWKNVASQSERQFGAYVILYAQAFGEEPILLNPNKEVSFRNSVIHKGYIPSKAEAIDYGNLIMKIIESSLIKLKSKYSMATNETFNYYGYSRLAHEQFKKIENETGVEQNFTTVNIMTTIDVIHGRELEADDGRIGDVEKRISSILDWRNPRKLTLLKDKPQV